MFQNSNFDNLDYKESMVFENNLFLYTMLNREIQKSNTLSEIKIIHDFSKFLNDTLKITLNSNKPFSFTYKIRFYDENNKCIQNYTSRDKNNFSKFIEEDKSTIPKQLATICLENITTHIDFSYFEILIISNKTSNYIDLYLDDFDTRIYYKFKKKFLRGTVSRIAEIHNYNGKLRLFPILN